MAREPFVGLWALADPAAEGPVRRGVCRITLADERLHADLSWVGRDGAGRRAAFEVAPDTLRLEEGGAVLVVAQEVDGRRVVARYHRVREDVKQVILYRRDLKMRKGKIAAQVAHASLKVLLDRDEGGWDRLEIPLDDAMASWARARFAKIVLSVDSEADLVRAYEAARAAGLPAALVVDAGRTEFHGVPTRTTVAIGPAPAADIDVITGPDGVIPTRLA